MSEYLAVIGLSFTLIGAALLFFYGYPKKTIGNTKIIGDAAFQFSEDDKHGHDPNWQPKANAFLERAKFFNRTGFLLITVGTALQIAAVSVQN